MLSDMAVNKRKPLAERAAAAGATGLGFAAGTGG
jgi:hypothetical protein